MADVIDFSLAKVDLAKPLESLNLCFIERLEVFSHPVDPYRHALVGLIGAMGIGLREFKTRTQAEQEKARLLKVIPLAQRAMYTKIMGFLHSYAAQVSS